MPGKKEFSWFHSVTDNFWKKLRKKYVKKIQKNRRCTELLRNHRKWSDYHYLISSVELEMNELYILGVPKEPRKVKLLGSTSASSSGNITDRSDQVQSYFSQLWHFIIEIIADSMAQSVEYATPSSVAWGTCFESREMRNFSQNYRKMRFERIGKSGQKPML